MLISQPISRCLTNHSELCMSRLLNNQPHRLSMYRLQRQPSFGFESSVSSTSMTSGDPVVRARLGSELELMDLQNSRSQSYKLLTCTQPLWLTWWTLTGVIHQHHQHHHHHFNDSSLGKPVLATCPTGSLPPTAPEQNLWGQLTVVLLQTRCPSHHPINSAKVLTHEWTKV